MTLAILYFPNGWSLPSRKIDIKKMSKFLFMKFRHETSIICIDHYFLLSMHDEPIIIINIPNNMHKNVYQRHSFKNTCFNYCICTQNINFTTIFQLLIFPFIIIL